MSTPRRITAQLTALDRMLENVMKQSTPALAAIKMRTADNDGYPSTASGADNGPGGTTESSTVERAVERRLGASDTKTGPVTDLENVSDFLASAALAFDNCIKILGRYSVGLTDTERQTLRCIGDDTPDGAECGEWASTNPTTGQANRKGMCVKCFTRSYRRTRQNEGAMAS